MRNPPGKTIIPSAFFLIAPRLANHFTRKAMLHTSKK
jgi:hypothetical protein